MMQNSVKKAGFTLIETLVAVGILGITISGIMTLTAASVRTLGIQKDKLIAAKIASEGIEFMINKRDNNIACLQSGGTCTLLCQGNPEWRLNLQDYPGNSCNFRDTSWEIDAAKPDQLLPNNNFYNYNSSNFICIENSGLNTGKFTYCGNDPTKMLPQQYTREVRVTDAGANDKVRVESIVRWKERFIGNQTITVEEVIFGSN